MRAPELRGSKGTIGLPRSVLCLALLLALPDAARAMQFSYEAGAGLRHHDNINLSDDDPLEEDVLFASLRFAAKHDSPKLEMRARGSVRYLSYLDDTFDDEVRGDLAAQVDWTILPNRLHWVAEDYLSQQAINVLASPAPENQQRVNVFVTGPSVMARLGAATQVQVDLRYMNSHAEETDSFNGDRLVVRGRLLREISPTVDGSFNIEASRAEFDDPAQSVDYDRWDAYVGIERRLPAVTMRADIGYTQLDPNGTGGNPSSPLLRALIDWRPSRRNAFSLRADYQFADAAQYLIRRSSELAAESDDAVLLTSADLLDNYETLGNAGLSIDSDTYKERRLDLGYRHNGDRLSFRVQPYAQRVRYETELNPQIVNLDRESNGEGFSLDYRLREQLSLSFRASHQRVRYQTIDRTDEISGLSVALSDRSSRQWRWRLELAHLDRESTTVGSSYTDNSISFTLLHTRR